MLCASSGRSPTARAAAPAEVVLPEFRPLAFGCPAAVTSHSDTRWGLRVAYSVRLNKPERGALMMCVFDGHHSR